MEANFPNSCSSSSCDNGNVAPVPGEKSAQQLDQEVGEKVMSAMGEVDNVWKMASEKQLMISRLRGEQIKVSDSFTRFYEISRTMEHSISGDMASYHHFTEISEQVQVLAHFLDDFEIKLKRSEKIVLDLIRDTRAHIKLLKQNIDSARESQDLEGLQLPTLHWIESIPDPEVETLVDEWELIQLDDKMTQYLRQMEDLVDMGGMVAHVEVEYDDQP